MPIGRKTLGGIKATLTERAPGFGIKDFGIQFVFPQHLQRLALGIVIQTRQTDPRGMACYWWRNHVFNKIVALANLNPLAWLEGGADVHSRGTYANLRGYIKAKGGHVLHAQALTG